MRNTKTTLLVFLLLGVISANARAADAALAKLEEQFTQNVHPFLQTYCYRCHGNDKPEADLDLSAYTSLSAVAKDSQHAALVLARLKADEMPPKEAKTRPSAQIRQQAIDWFQAFRDDQTQRNAGDPGTVLARRLSNAEFDYTIRDLTGVDLRPTREFPLDPSNTAGFDNSGESLVMSPSLLTKYLAEAHEIADHMYLTPTGFSFAPYTMLAETDRDKFCIQPIINLYHRYDTDYADFFLAAWRFKNRAALGRPDATLADMAASGNVSAKYLATVWSTLETREEVGPLVKLQAMWNALPAGQSQAAAAQRGCVQMRDYVVQLRKKVEPRFWNITAGKINPISQPLLIWKNVQYATHRRTFDPAQLQMPGDPAPAPLKEPEPGASSDFGPGKTVLIKNVVGDPDLVVPAGQRPRYEAAFAKFCSVFPDMFYMQERGRNYFNTSKDRGRYLSAGFHSVMGYFRDDQPLYELILDEKEQKELDDLWFEFDFMASATERMYIEFFTNGTLQAGGRDDAANAASKVAVDSDLTSEIRIRKAEATYLALTNGDEPGATAIKEYFEWINKVARTVEKAKADGIPLQLDALMKFAAKAYRRPMTNEERADLLTFYNACREKDGLNHESALRETIVAVLMSPDLGYRIDLIQGGPGVHPLSDYDLASRLSYFLWSSMPDDELLAHAAAGDLHKPDVMAAQARRMLKDARIRALAVEFGGNWLDFRRFEDLTTVDRDKFKAFSNELRDAMFEEPVRFLADVFQNDRSVLDLLYANDTFVNPTLSRHYGIPVRSGRSDEWVRVPDANKYDRGGILPMAVFLTKNAPGLRTSPVKRGNWVVRNILGERIPPPPPTVPELPKDESKLDLPLREVLARHRADPSCAACHARFDSLGLVFEGFGPIGERRDKDLAGHPVDASASFPDNSGDGTGIAGLRQYIRDHRQDDFVNNFCGKLLAYGLGRSLILSDDLLIKEMREKGATSGYKFDGLIEAIVTSPQFLNKRGSETLAER